MQRTVAVPDEHIDKVGRRLLVAGGHGHVLLAVAGQIADGHFAEAVALEDGLGRRLESAVAVAQEDIKRSGVAFLVIRAVVADDQIKLAVAVEVGQGDGLGIVADGQRRGIPEGAVAVAKQNTYSRGVFVGDQDISVAVAQVSDGDGRGMVADGIKPRRGENAVPIVEHDSQEAVGTIGRDNILIPVSGEVCGGDNNVAAIGVNVGLDRGLESAVPVSKHHVNVTVFAADDDVRMAVPVHVGHRDRARIIDARVGVRRLERAVAVAQQDAHRAVLFVQNVGLAVAVKITRRDIHRRVSSQDIGDVPERAVAVAEIEADGIGYKVHRDPVNGSIAGEVGDGGRINVGLRVNDG